MESDPYDLEGKAKAAKERDDRARLKANTEKGDLSWLMSQKRGRRIVWGLLEQFGIYQLSFDASSTEQTAFNEGRRNQGLRLYAQILEACPERLGEMTLEAQQRKDEDA